MTQGVEATLTDIEAIDIIEINPRSQILGFGGDVVLRAIDWYEKRTGTVYIYSPFMSGKFYVQKEFIEKLQEEKEKAERLIVDISGHEILDAIPIKDAAFVYFLFDEKTLVYIGQSVCLCGRIAGHKKQKKFDGVICKEFDKKILTLAENVNIRKYRPILNLAVEEDFYFLTALLSSMDA